MYEDSWYSFVPEHTHKKNPSVSQTGRKRGESLLQQPNVRLPAPFALRFW